MSSSATAPAATVTTNRREFLFGLGTTLGTVAFNAMVQAEERAALPAGLLAPRPQQVPAKAKACIWLTMHGGPSHVDTFDPKPKLDKLHLTEFQREDRFASAMASGTRYFVKSPFRFRKVGESGLEICTNFAHLARVADELCVYKGCVAESIDHPTAMYHINTGNRFGGDPAVGSWITYGLGTLNANLPGFIVLPEVTYPQGGAANWSNGFLPAHFQGTPLRATGSPILDLVPPRYVSRDAQRANLDLLAALNRNHLAHHPRHEELAARMESYELAFRMQSIVPDLIDLRKETAETLKLYGVGREPTDAFGRRCLLARRLVEQGVRFVQIYSDGWDSHDYLERSHSRRIEATDQALAGLLTDLKRRGMLDETLVIWGGEFGRSPDNGIRAGGIAYGRDHNAKAMALWLAGGGVKAGHVIGATDEIGAEAVECVHPIRDLHVTILRLLGLDDNKLTYFHGGRFKQLSQIGGRVIGELMA
jgi:hypothetical protein